MTVTGKPALLNLIADPYASIGVRPFINCCSTRTVHGGSIIAPEVRAAMAAASSRFVNLNELMAAARPRIAQLTGAEDGIVTAGSAAAIAIATAAAIAGNDPVRMLRLPDTFGMAADVVMLNGHRFPYDQAIRMVGARIIEVETVAELEALDFTHVAMAGWLGTRDSSASIPFETLVRISRSHKVPVLVDAASEHIGRPNVWLSRGADLVVYSGGKFLRGPQTSGFLLGRHDLIEMAWANSPPHRAFGRPMKIGKEDVIGAVAALELWFSRDEADERSRWQRDIDAIAAEVTALPGVAVEQLPADEGDRVPQLRITWNVAALPMHGLELRRRLLAGTPRIMLDDMSAGEGATTLELFSLQPGEAKLVGSAIAAALQEATALAPSAAPLADISGSWDLQIAFARHARVHQLSLRQTGAAVTGEQASAGFSGLVTGSVRYRDVTLVLEASYEGAIIRYQLDGTINGTTMSGINTLGSTTTHTRGEVSYAQYGTAPWTARRR